MLFTRFVPFPSISITLVLVMVAAYSASAQTFGGLRPSLKWSQINTDTCRVIFPAHLEREAQRVSDVIHHMRKFHTSEIGDRTYKIDIVLNNQSTVTNGSVSLAPWKSHFLSTPFPHSYPLSSLPWWDLLSIHEYRHVMQRSTARRGIVNALYYMFGQETWAGASSLAIPNWFYEGDAVWAETALTRQGRGRIPEFMKGYRALSLSDQTLRYSKARNGSIKDFIPDHYRLGYLMISYGQEHYGESLWREVLEESAAYKGIFYPFSKALERKTGMTSRALFDTMISEEHTDWDTLVSNQSKAAIVLPDKTSNTFTDYLYPKVSDDGDIIFYGRSFEQTGAFYRLHDGQTEKLIDKGVSRSTYYGYQNEWLAWTETMTDARWLETDYSNIILYDLRKDKRVRITRKGKYFSPQPSRDGRQVVAVWQGDDLTSRIHIVDAMDGTVAESISLNEEWIYNFPQWSSSGDEIITVVRNGVGEMGILAIDIKSLRHREILPFSNTLIGAIQVTDNNIVFSAYDMPVEQIFVVNQESLETRCLTNDPNGAYQAFLSGNELLFTSFTSDGHRIKKLMTDQIDHDDRSLKQIPYQLDMPAKVSKQDYPVKKYRAWQHLINLHTWGFDFDDPVISFRALSNNILNNLQVSAGVRYNYDADLFAPYANMQLGAFYPNFVLETSTQKRSTIAEDEEINWRESDIFSGLSLPLNLSRGIYTRTLSTVLGYSQIWLNGDLDFSLSSVIGQITFVQKRIQARKNLFTRNGQYLQFRISESVDDLSARQFLFRSGLSLPGIGVNHNLMLLADYKGDLDDGDYQFTSGLNQRGFGLIEADKIWRLSANYHMPVFYPDWGFGGLVYFYRIRSNVWFEHSIGELEGERNNYSSTGIELVFDMNILNETTATIGLRASFTLDTDPTGSMFEVFVPVYRF